MGDYYGEKDIVIVDGRISRVEELRTQLRDDDAVYSGHRAHGHAIAKGVPNAELRIFEQSGHMTFVEEPELYIATVRSFLARTV